MGASRLGVVNSLCYPSTLSLSVESLTLLVSRETPWLTGAYSSGHCWTSRLLLFWPLLGKPSALHPGAYSSGHCWQSAHLPPYSSGHCWQVTHSR